MQQDLLLDCGAFEKLNEYIVENFTQLTAR